MEVQISDYVVQIDVDDYPWFSENGPWYVGRYGGSPYVVRSPRRFRPTREFLHRLFINPQDGFVCDHISGDTLDNRRQNLRECRQKDNLKNRKKPSHNTSGYKGVYPKRDRWCAEITSDGRRYRLGCFGTPKQAARAYDAAAIKHHGEFARTNVQLGLI